MKTLHKEALLKSIEEWWDFPHQLKTSGQFYEYIERFPSRDTYTLQQAARYIIDLARQGGETYRSDEICDIVRALDQGKEF